ncbi:hypothetical protein TCON_0701 [Astathelohania contejeani]|uniref:Uncharacterized protein n=1 Tax=Astathelohania contejeani TaxID=164912 RepID=A0ABQ7I0W4_9MICR|nr:hypothetical protein TCON_0701 [Thelohania contejeani]
MDTLKKYKNISSRRVAIMKIEEQNKTLHFLIYRNFGSKYSLIDVSAKNLLNSQHTLPYDKINKKKLHERLYRGRSNELVSLKDSSTWMKNRNNNFHTESIYCYIQDKNVFWRDDALQCQHCGKAKKSIDHLATGCDRMLGHDYTRRHNEVLRCIHLLLANKYGFKKSKKLRTHSVQEVMENERAEIRVDTRIRTDILIKNSRPDIFIYDKKEN